MTEWYLVWIEGLRGPEPQKWSSEGLWGQLGRTDPQPGQRPRVDLAARQAGPGTNAMLHENLACYVCVTELESWIDFDHWLIPTEFQA